MKTNVHTRRNANDTADIRSISVGDTANVLLHAPDIERIFFCVQVSPDATDGVWLKLKPALSPDSKRGIYLGPGERWQMDSMNVYTGGTCAISRSGTQEVFVTDY